MEPAARLSAVATRVAATRLDLVDRAFDQFAGLENLPQLAAVLFSQRAFRRRRYCSERRRKEARCSTLSERTRFRPASLQESTVAGWSRPRGLAQWQPGLPLR